MLIELIESTYAVAINVKPKNRTEIYIGLLVIFPRCPQTIQLNDWIIKTPEDGVNQTVPEIYTEDTYKILKYV